MNSKTVAPFGFWESPISVDTVVSKSRKLSSPRSSAQSGRAFYTESRESGGISLVEIVEDGVRDVLPSAYSAKNSVYEYGGTPYAVLPDDRIIFSNKDDTIHVLNPDTKEVSLLSSGAKLRYSDFDAHPSQLWVLAIQEDHENDTPYGVRNYVVAINTQTGEVKRILETADFYYTPYFSPDGTKLVWLEWNHPDLLFDAAKLYLASWGSDGSVSDIRLIAGENHEDVAEPRWGTDGSLFFAKESNGYRRLFRTPPGQEEATEVPIDGLDEFEFGEIRLYQGSHTYAPLSEKFLVACPVKAGQSQVTLIDLDTGAWKVLVDASTNSEAAVDAVARLNDSSFLLIGAGTSNPQALYRCDIEEGSRITTIRKSAEQELPESVYSIPEPITITSKESPSRRIHGFLWAPHNPDFDASAGDLPPLIVLVHGGPTSHTGPGLKLRIQYFTSRGYAVLGLNHTGSTGHGRVYRGALFGYWGLVDSDDAAEFASYLVTNGRIRAGAVGITGVSAGGYNTLRTLTRHPKAFAAGVCLSGISDLKRLDEATHKLESDYADHLIMPPGSTKEDKERICRERSPLFHVDKIESPLLLLHGEKDMVTPLDQAQEMAGAIAAQGGDVKIIVVPDEGHGFSLPHNAKLWLEEEEKWWRRTLL